METEKIKNIILGYCDGIGHLEFNESDLPEMVEKIKEAILYELDDAEFIKDARNYVKDYL